MEYYFSHTSTTMPFYVIMKNRPSFSMPSEQNRPQEDQQDISSYSNAAYSIRNSPSILEGNPRAENMGSFIGWNAEPQYPPEEHYNPSFAGHGQNHWFPDYYHPPTDLGYSRLSGAHNSQYQFANSHQPVPLPSSGYPLPSGDRTISDAAQNEQTSFVPYSRRMPPAPSYWEQVSPVRNLPGGAALYQQDYQHRPQHSQQSAPVSGRAHQTPLQIAVQNSLPPLPKLERVFIWELDETIIIFHSLLSGYFASKYKKNTQSLMSLGYKIENMIVDLLDKQFFLYDLEVCQPSHIDDVLGEDKRQDVAGCSDGYSSYLTAFAGNDVDLLRKLASEYRKIKETYSNNRASVEDILEPERRDEWQRLMAQVEAVSNNWLDSAAECLARIHARYNCLNVMVTNSKLVPALAKTLLFGLGDFFPIENIYSSNKLGKERCFARIAARFAKTKCNFVVIGCGTEEEIAARQMNFPFWKISSQTDLISMMRALDMELL